MRLPDSTTYHFLVDGEPACHGAHFSEDRRDEWVILPVEEAAEKFDLCGTCCDCYEPYHGVTLGYMRKRIAEAVSTEYDEQQPVFDRETVVRIYEELVLG